MSFSYASILDGSVMSASGVGAALDGLFNYLQGGGVEGDIPSGTVGRTAIFRPDLYGFPVQGFRAPSSHGYSRAVINPGAHHVRTTERYDIPTFGLATDAEFPILGMGASIDLPRASLVYMEAHLNVVGCGDAVVYPEDDGTVWWVVRDRSTGVDTTYAASSREIRRTGNRTTSITYGILWNQKSVINVATLAAGSYDVFLTYRRTVAAYGHRAVSFGHRSMKIRAYRSQQ